MHTDAYLKKKKNPNQTKPNHKKTRNNTDVENDVMPTTFTSSMLELYEEINEESKMQ